MLKIHSFHFQCLKRSVYTAIKSISDPQSSFSASSSIGTSAARMQAWIIYYYGDNQQFTFSDSVQMPILHSPKDVLIKISAASLNPVDIRRRGIVIVDEFFAIELRFQRVMVEN